MSKVALSALIAATLAMATGASAQTQQAPPVGGQVYGARAGNSYVPSTHEPGCGGALCDGNDPARLAGPPPPCEGLICGISPYSMQRPVTAAEAQRLQEEQARAAAAAPAEPTAPAPRAKSRRKSAAKAKAKAPAKAVAARTPDPARAPAPAAQ